MLTPRHRRETIIPIDKDDYVQAYADMQQAQNALRIVMQSTKEMKALFEATLKCDQSYDV